MAVFDTQELSVNSFDIFSVFFGKDNYLYFARLLLIPRTIELSLVYNKLMKSCRQPWKVNKA